MADTTINAIVHLDADNSSHVRLLAALVAGGDVVEASFISDFIGGDLFDGAEEVSEAESVIAEIVGEEAAADIIGALDDAGLLVATDSDDTILPAPGADITD